MSVLQSVSDVAGVSGFFLGVANYWRSRGAPAREEKRKEGNSFRELLFDAKFDLTRAIKTIDSAGDLDQDEPASLQTLQDAIPRYRKTLDAPTSRSLNDLDVMLASLHAAWTVVCSHIRDAGSDFSKSYDPHGRKRAAVERNARDAFEHTNRMIDQMIEDINKANRS